MNRWAVVLVLAGSLAVLAQEVQTPAPPPPAPPAAVVAPASPKVAFTLQPLPWLIGSYGATIDYALSDKVTFSIAFNIQASVASLSQSQNPGTVGLSLFGVGAQPGISYFLTGKAPGGMWIGPKLEAGYLAATTSQNSGTSTFSSTFGALNFGVHAMVGYNHIFESGFVIQMGLGLGFTFASATVLSSSSTAPPPMPPLTNIPTLNVLALFSRASLGFGWSF